jgi:hypothetical protein
MAARPFTTKAVHWTPRRINAALKCPKPAGAIAKVYHFDGGDILRPRARPSDIELLDHLANHADLLDVPARTLDCFGRSVRWLLVPMPDELLSRLAEFGADIEDHEPDHDREADADREPDEDDEADGVEERADVRPESMDRCGFPYHEGPELVVTAAQRQRYSYSTDRRTMQQAKAFIRTQVGAGR